MSNFRRFRLPQLLIKETHHDDTIPRFECNKLVVKDRIGQGAFGDLYTMDYRGGGGGFYLKTTSKLGAFTKKLLPNGGLDEGKGGGGC